MLIKMLIISHSYYTSKYLPLMTTTNNTIVTTGPIITPILSPLDGEGIVVLMMSRNNTTNYIYALY